MVEWVRVVDADLEFELVEEDADADADADADGIVDEVVQVRQTTLLIVLLPGTGWC